MEKEEGLWIVRKHENLLFFQSVHHPPHPTGWRVHVTNGRVHTSRLSCWNAWHSDEVEKGKENLPVDKMKNSNRKSKVGQRWRTRGRKRKLCITGKVSTSSPQEVDPIMEQWFAFFPPTSNL